MHQNTSRKWFWLMLIASGYIVLALVATFKPELLNQTIGPGPATWGLVASVAYLVFIVSIMAIAIFSSRPSAREENR